MTNNWQIKKLGDIFQIERGGSPRPIEKFLTTDENGINWIKIGDTKNITKYIYKTEQKIKPSGLSKTRIVNDGDFILSNSMSFGRPYIMKTTGAIHDGWLVLRKKLPNIDKDFFYYLLGSPVVFNQFDNLAAGSTVRNLNTKLVASVEVPFPSLVEQKRIVKILDEVFENVEKAKENNEKNLNNSKELFESYLQNVFASPGKDWEEKSLEELGQITSSKRIYKKEYVSDGVPFYRIKEIKELAHDKNITLELFISRKRYKEIKDIFGVPMIGDILMTAVGTIGEIYVVKNEEEFYFKDGNILWFKNFDSVNPYFLKFVLMSFVEQINKLSKGSAYSALTIEKIEKHKIFLPKSLAEQKLIVKKLDTLSEQTKKLEEVYKKKLADLEELKKSVLKKAFSGEL